MLEEKLPEGVVHLFQDRLYLESMPSVPSYTIVGGLGNLGRRLALGPLCVEYYTCDKEPDLTPFRGLRFVIWTPVTRRDIPKSWYRFPFKSTQTVCAFVDIKNTHEYYKSWSDTFKTYYNRFTKQVKYKISEISCDEFCEMYEKYTTKQILARMNVAQMKKITSLDKQRSYFYILQDGRTEEVLAGISSIDCPSVGQSFYITAFTRKDIAPKESGLWLLHYWMKESGKRGLVYANLGNIWTEGQPTSWKGFSDFKLKFNPRFIVLQKELVRCTFSLFG